MYLKILPIIMSSCMKMPILKKGFKNIPLIALMTKQEYYEMIFIMKQSLGKDESRIFQDNILKHKFAEADLKEKFKNRLKLLKLNPKQQMSRKNIIKINRIIHKKKFVGYSKIKKGFISQWLSFLNWKLAIYDFPLLKEETIPATDEYDNLYYYKMERSNIHSEISEVDNEKDKSLQNTLQLYVDSLDDGFEESSVDFVIAEFIKCKNKNLFWQTSYYPIFIKLISKVFNNSNIETKSNVEKITNFYMNNLEKENKNRFAVHFLYNILKSADHSKYLISYIINILKGKEKEYNEKIESILMVEYVYNHFQSNIQKYKDNLEDFVDFISFENWLSIGISNGKS